MKLPTVEDALSPIQPSNKSRALSCRVLDRSLARVQVRRQLELATAVFLCVIDGSKPLIPICVSVTRDLEVL